MEFLAATNNKGKLKEIERILSSQGHTCVSLKDINLDIDVDETGTTFEENAILKAKEVCEIAKMPVIADDSGLEVDYLNGEPGVYTARYCGHHGDDEANNDKLLFNLQGIEEEKRSAKFVSAVCLYMPSGKNLVTRGECTGFIGFERKGDNGFGYDPIFIPEFMGEKNAVRKNSEKLSYAQLSADEKDGISHRGVAMEELSLKLNTFLSE